MPKLKKVIKRSYNNIEALSYNAGRKKSLDNIEECRLAIIATFFGTEKDDLLYKKL